MAKNNPKNRITPAAPKAENAADLAKRGIRRGPMPPVPAAGGLGGLGTLASSLNPFRVEPAMAANESAVPAPAPAPAPAPVRTAQPVAPQVSAAEQQRKQFEDASSQYVSNFSSVLDSLVNAGIIGAEDRDFLSTRLSELISDPLTNITSLGNRSKKYKKFSKALKGFEQDIAPYLSDEGKKAVFEAFNQTRKGLGQALSYGSSQDPEFAAQRKNIQFTGPEKFFAGASVGALESPAVSSAIASGMGVKGLELGEDDQTLAYQAGRMAGQLTPLLLELVTTGGVLSATKYAGLRAIPGIKQIIPGLQKMAAAGPKRAALAAVISQGAKDAAAAGIQGALAKPSQYVFGTGRQNRPALSDLPATGAAFAKGAAELATGTAAAGVGGALSKGVDLSKASALGKAATDIAGQSAVQYGFEAMTGQPHELQNYLLPGAFGLMRLGERGRGLLPGARRPGEVAGAPEAVSTAAQLDAALAQAGLDPTTISILSPEQKLEAYNAYMGISPTAPTQTAATPGALDASNQRLAQALREIGINPRRAAGRRAPIQGEEGTLQSPMSREDLAAFESAEANRARRELDQLRPQTVSESREITRAIDQIDPDGTKTIQELQQELRDVQEFIRNNPNVPAMDIGQGLQVGVYYPPDLVAAYQTLLRQKAITQLRSADQNRQVRDVLARTKADQAARDQAYADLIATTGTAPTPASAPGSPADILREALQRGLITPESLTSQERSYFTPEELASFGQGTVPEAPVAPMAPEAPTALEAVDPRRQALEAYIQSFGIPEVNARLGRASVEDLQVTANSLYELEQSGMGRGGLTPSSLGAAGRRPEPQLGIAGLLGSDPETVAALAARGLTPEQAASMLSARGARGALDLEGAQREREAFDPLAVTAAQFGMTPEQLRAQYAAGMPLEQMGTFSPLPGAASPLPGAASPLPAAQSFARVVTRLADSGMSDLQIAADLGVSLEAVTAITGREIPSPLQPSPPRGKSPQQRQREEAAQRAAEFEAARQARLAKLEGAASALPSAASALPSAPTDPLARLLQDLQAGQPGRRAQAGLMTPAMEELLAPRAAAPEVPPAPAPAPAAAPRMSTRERLLAAEKRKQQIAAMRARVARTPEEALVRAGLKEPKAAPTAAELAANIPGVAPQGGLPTPTAEQMAPAAQPKPKGRRGKKSPSEGEAVTPAPTAEVTPEVAPEIPAPPASSGIQRGETINIPTASDYPSTVMGVDVDDIKVDPEAYQFKSGGDDEGVTDSLDKEQTWNVDAAGVIMLHRRLNGDLYVANGHQRTGLARRLKAAGKDVPPLLARVYDEADGITVPMMRRRAALVNISENNTAILDAAKLLREGQLTAQERGMLPKKRSVVISAENLAKLNDEAFQLVVNEIVEPRFAALVPKYISGADEQLATLKILAKNKPASETEADIMVQDIRRAGFRKVENMTLFGMNEEAESLVKPRAKIIEGLRRQLTSERSAFANAVRNESRLAEQGNILATEANVAGRDTASQIAQFLDIEFNKSGEFSDAVSEAARKLLKGEINDQQAVKLARDAIERSLAELTGRGAGRPAGGAARPDGEEVRAGERPAEAAPVQPAEPVVEAAQPVEPPPSRPTSVQTPEAVELQPLLMSDDRVAYLQEMARRPESDNVLILQCGDDKVSTPGNIPAIDRYNGPMFQSLRKFLRDNGYRTPDEAGFDVYIISAKYGLLRWSDLIPDYNVSIKSIRERGTYMSKLRSHVTSALNIVTRPKGTGRPTGPNAIPRNVQAFVGKDYMPLIGDLTSGTLANDQGGIGVKRAGLGKWLQTTVGKTESTQPAVEAAQPVVEARPIRGELVKKPKPVEVSTEPAPKDILSPTYILSPTELLNYVKNVDRVKKLRESIKELETKIRDRKNKYGYNLTTSNMVDSYNKKISENKTKIDRILAEYSNQDFIDRLINMISQSDLPDTILWAGDYNGTPLRNYVNDDLPDEIFTRDQQIASYERRKAALDVKNPERVKERLNKQVDNLRSNLSLIEPGEKATPIALRQLYNQRFVETTPSLQGISEADRRIQLRQNLYDVLSQSPEEIVNEFAKLRIIIKSDVAALLKRIMLPELSAQENIVKSEPIVTERPGQIEGQTAAITDQEAAAPATPSGLQRDIIETTQRSTKRGESAPAEGLFESTGAMQTGFDLGIEGARGEDVPARTLFEIFGDNLDEDIRMLIEPERRPTEVQGPEARPMAEVSGEPQTATVETVPRPKYSMDNPPPEDSYSVTRRGVNKKGRETGGNIQTDDLDVARFWAEQESWFISDRGEDVAKRTNKTSGRVTPRYFVGPNRIPGLPTVPREEVAPARPTPAAAPADTGAGAPPPPPPPPTGGRPSGPEEPEGGRPPDWVGEYRKASNIKPLEPGTGRPLPPANAAQLLTDVVDEFLRVGFYGRITKAAAEQIRKKYPNLNIEGGFDTEKGRDKLMGALADAVGIGMEDKIKGWADYFQQGKTAPSFRAGLLRSLLERNGIDPRYAEYVDRIHINQGRREGAIKQIEAALRQEFPDARTMEEAARQLVTMQKIDNPTLQAAIELIGQNAESLVALEMITPGVAMRLRERYIRLKEAEMSDPDRSFLEKFVKPAVRTIRLRGAKTAKYRGRDAWFESREEINKRNDTWNIVEQDDSNPERIKYVLENSKGDRESVTDSELDDWNLAGDNREGNLWNILERKSDGRLHAVRDMSSREFERSNISKDPVKLIADTLKYQGRMEQQGQLLKMVAENPDFANRATYLVKFSDIKNVTPRGNMGLREIMRDESGEITGLRMVNSMGEEVLMAPSEFHQQHLGDIIGVENDVKAGNIRKGEETSYFGRPVQFEGETWITNDIELMGKSEDHEWTITNPRTGDTKRVKQKELIPWRLVRNEGLKLQPGQTNWGALDEHFVRPDVAADLAMRYDMVPFLKETMKLIRPLSRLFKAPLVIGNPAAYVTQFVQNAATSLLHGSGPADWPLAWQIMKGQDEDYRALRNYYDERGLFSDSLYSIDVEGAPPPTKARDAWKAFFKTIPASMQDGVKPSEVLRAFGYASRETGGVALKLWTFMDDFFRVCVATSLERRGMTRDEAIKRARDLTYHGRSPEAVQFASNTIVPFANVNYWTTFKLPRLVIENPTRILQTAGVVATLGMVNGAMRALAGNQEDTEEYRKAREALRPAYESSFPIQLMPTRTLVSGQTTVNKRPVDIEMRTGVYDVTKPSGAIPQLGGPLVDAANLVLGASAELQAGRSMQSAMIEGVRRVRPTTGARTGENVVLPDNAEFFDAVNYMIKRQIPLYSKLADVVDPKDKTRGFAIQRMFLPLEAVQIERGARSQTIKAKGMQNTVRKEVLKIKSQYKEGRISKDEAEKRIRAVVDEYRKQMAINAETRKTVKAGLDAIKKSRE